jgi:hypothetical protein
MLHGQSNIKFDIELVSEKSCFYDQNKAGDNVQNTLFKSVHIYNQNQT